VPSIVEIVTGENEVDDAIVRAAKTPDEFAPDSEGCRCVDTDHGPDLQRIDRSLRMLVRTHELSRLTTAEVGRVLTTAAVL